MIRRAAPETIQALRNVLYPMQKTKPDYKPLLELIGDARFVLLGEATHGSAEFYRARDEITNYLISNKGFRAVAVEADFPDAYRVNKYIRGIGQDQSAIEATNDFKRFPQWMWRNTDAIAFVETLRNYNKGKNVDNQVGFYGLDLYSMYSSIDAVITYLDKVDPLAGKLARKRYECFEQFGREEDSYGLAMTYISEDCRQQALQQLVDLHEKSTEYIAQDSFIRSEEFFNAEQNARLARDAEQYYREMFRGRINTWNIRDHHMVNTIAELSEHMTKLTGSGKVVIWAHNSHIGNALATEMAQTGELNVGQLIREKYEDDVVLIGFTTYNGTVSAASHWGGNVERKQIRPALHGSIEDLFHQTDIKNFFLNLRDTRREIEALQDEYLERAIGVIYSPESERASHYFKARLTEQFDAILHFDTTSALEPLEKNPVWIRGEIPETFDTGL